MNHLTIGKLAGRIVLTGLRLGSFTFRIVLPAAAMGTIVYSGYKAAKSKHKKDAQAKKLKA
ncbi:MAG: hypothetical protein D3926_02345 [Desulfobacteraceae bacterium]|mgnify:CR=1 FL=1|nr:MAG: hypothetical protein D3926_02345 [Desulfobacteraceae bacterium]